MLETLPKRVRAGFALATAAAITIVGTILLRQIHHLRPYDLLFVVGFGVVGLVLFLFPQRWILNEEHPLLFLKSARYWGAVIVFSVLPIFCIRHWLADKTSREPPPIAAPAVPKAPPVFPELTVTGLVCRETNSSAVINGLTVTVGKMVEGVTVVAIDRDGVTVEMAGARKPIPYGK